MLTRHALTSAPGRGQAVGGGGLGLLSLLSGRSIVQSSQLRDLGRALVAGLLKTAAAVTICARTPQGCNSQVGIRLTGILTAQRESETGRSEHVLQAPAGVSPNSLE
jgi:hypothetical protein